MNMIEKVAQAIADNANTPFPLNIEDARYAAIAAIEAMREPTEAMKDAPYEAEIDFGPGGGDNDAGAENVWQAMINAALEGK